MGIMIMKKRNGEPTPRDAVQKIQSLIDSIPEGARNHTEKFYLNNIQNEFVTFPDEISIPRIHVKELDYPCGIEIIKNLSEILPLYFQGHLMLEKRIPAAEQHSLHFSKKLQGKCLDFTHLFKIDFKFGGDPDSIIEKGTPDFYPAYKTNRIYYKSLLVPESTIHRTRTEQGLDPVRIREADEVDSDQFFHTFAIFDETDRSEITKEFYQVLSLPEETFGISPALYPIVEYNYFTACFNVIDPTEENLVAGTKIFEPLFLLLYGRKRNLGEIVNTEAIEEYYGDLLSLKGSKIFPTDKFLSLLKNYFHKYRLVRNDEIILKGWWKFEETAS